ncbi:hypothetical protein BACCOPRO_02226 [Phocaeicola coprophilus DSM 18228 = JCM 13818]|uniref:Uncharacterized protein n=1 Tax=Phocaeicola coprophilus DSM 18228 = JCM 13818 TaxID=547042 RepID=S0F9F7_9BACT|nr:hypothetical protein BACCOPRO_02226 [Phocaeicola coprophilus DSM 18228 = JCM 13818]
MIFYSGNLQKKSEKACRLKDYTYLCNRKSNLSILKSQNYVFRRS